MNNIILYFIIPLISIMNCKAQSDICPKPNKYTSEMMKKVLVDDKNQSLRIQSGIQNLQMGDVSVLQNSDYTAVCKMLKKKNDNYSSKDNERPTTITYFKSDNFYFVIVHFSDTILKEKNGRITGNSGPPGAAKIYDKNLNLIAEQIIW
jgi:hypothetical protein